MDEQGDPGQKRKHNSHFYKEKKDLGSYKPVSLTSMPARSWSRSYSKLF